MYILLLVLSAFSVAASDVLAYAFKDSIFYNKKPTWFWDHWYYHNEAQKYAEVNIQVRKNGFEWFNARRLFNWLGLFWLILSVVCSGVPMFQIRGIPILYQLIGCIVIYAFIYNYAFRKIFIKNK